MIDKRWKSSRVIPRIDFYFCWRPFEFDSPFPLRTAAVIVE